MMMSPCTRRSLSGSGCSASHSPTLSSCLRLPAILTDLQKDDDPSRGFWVEGRIYAVSARKEDKERWRECEYNAVKVLWYEQDLAMPDRWAIEIYQTSNTLSPWVRSCRCRCCSFRSAAAMHP